MPIKRAIGDFLFSLLFAHVRDSLEDCEHLYCMNFKYITYYIKHVYHELQFFKSIFINLPNLGFLKISENNYGIKETW